jgi:nitroreductase
LESRCREKEMLTVAEAMKSRRSTRSFTGEPVFRGDILYMLEAARLAPSASNSQPWRFVVVTDPAEKKELRRLCFGQPFIEQAGVVFVVCADLSSYSGQTRLKRRQEAVDAGVLPAASLTDPGFERAVSEADPDLAAFITPATANTYIAVEHLVLMAEALGLGSCWVGAISDREEMKRLLGVPAEIPLLSVVAVGHIAGERPERPKLGLEDILLRPLP